METKICKKCEEEKPATREYFYGSKCCRDGLIGSCKACEIKDGKKYRDENPEKIKEQRDRRRERQQYTNKLWREKNKERISKYRKWYYEGNADILRNHAKEYHKKNRDTRKKYQQKYRAENIEYIRERRRQHYLENKTQNLIYRRTRIAREKGLDADYSKEIWELAKKHFNNSCAYCGEVGEVLHQEHLVPVVSGGGYTRNNIIPSCPRCNNSKYALVFEDWYPEQPFYSKKRELKILKYLGFDKEMKIQQLALF